MLELIVKGRVFLSPGLAFGDIPSTSAVMLNGLIHHSGVSLVFSNLVASRPFVDWAADFLLLIMLGFTIDVLLYLAGTRRRNHQKRPMVVTGNAPFFFILMRFIPFLGYFGAYFGAMYSEKIQITPHMIYILVGNVVFSIINIVTFDAVIAGL